MNRKIIRYFVLIMGIGVFLVSLAFTMWFAYMPYYRHKDLIITSLTDKHGYNLTHLSVQSLEHPTTCIGTADYNELGPNKIALLLKDQLFEIFGTQDLYLWIRVDKEKIGRTIGTDHVFLVFSDGQDPLWNTIEIEIWSVTT